MTAPIPYAFPHRDELVARHRRAFAIWPLGLAMPILCVCGYGAFAMFSQPLLAHAEDLAMVAGAGALGLVLLGLGIFLARRTPSFVRVLRDQPSSVVRVTPITTVTGLANQYSITLHLANEEIVNLEVPTAEMRREIVQHLQLTMPKAKFPTS